MVLGFICGNRDCRNSGAFYNDFGAFTMFQDAFKHCCTFVFDLSGKDTKLQDVRYGA